MMIGKFVGYRVLSFMDAYLGYDHIKINPIDAPKTTFLTTTSTITMK